MKKNFYLVFLLMFSALLNGCGDNTEEYRQRAEVFAKQVSVAEYSSQVSDAYSELKKDIGSENISKVQDIVDKAIEQYNLKMCRKAADTFAKQVNKAVTMTQLKNAYSKLKKDIGTENVSKVQDIVDKAVEQFLLKKLAEADSMYILNQMALSYVSDLTFRHLSNPQICEYIDEIVQYATDHPDTHGSFFHRYRAIFPLFVEYYDKGRAGKKYCDSFRNAATRSMVRFAKKELKASDSEYTPSRINEEYNLYRKVGLGEIFFKGELGELINKAMVKAAIVYGKDATGVNSTTNIFKGENNYIFTILRIFLNEQQFKVFSQRLLCMKFKLKEKKYGRACLEKVHGVNEVEKLESAPISYTDFVHSISSIPYGGN